MEPRIDSCVRLLQPVPDLDLHPGDIGTVRSTWFSPAVMYEVEFAGCGCSCGVRLLLQAEQIESVEQRQGN
jgi:hypothetical protein